VSFASRDAIGLGSVARAALLFELRTCAPGVVLLLLLPSCDVHPSTSLPMSCVSHVLIISAS
jgi:hypothetical protein